jgi:transposase
VKSITDFSEVTTVGLDLAKHIFQVHGVDASGRVVVAKSIRRSKLLEFFASLPPCLVGLEACGSTQAYAVIFNGPSHPQRAVCRRRSHAHSGTAGGNRGRALSAATRG